MAQGGIFMSKNEQFTHQVISDFLSAKITRRQASELLQVRERTVSRMARRIEAKGLLGAIHGNRGRQAANRIEERFRTEVMALVEKRYFDFNMVHALEILKAEHGIKVAYTTFRRWCHAKHLVKRHHKRRPTARHKRIRMPNEGLLLQFDGSHHRWNGQNEWCLIGAIDDATSDIPHAEFFLSEDSLNCMAVMQRIIEAKGIPYAVYVDRAGWFGGGKRQNFAQFKRACEELSIRVIFANSAEAKGRIERTWGTIQDRLVPEMRLRKIRNIPSANDYLHNQFLPNYWKTNNTVRAHSLETRYRALPRGVKLNEIFCLKEFRSVRGDHTISWENELHRVESPLKYSIQGQQIEIRTYQDMTRKTYFAGRLITLTRIPNSHPNPNRWKTEKAGG
jgi:transposase